MISENSWLYFFPSEIEIKIECSDFRTTSRLNQCGILTLQSRCQAKIKNIVLVTTNTYTKTLQVSPIEIIPKTDFSMPEGMSKVLEENNTTLKIQVADHKEHKNILQDNKNTFTTLLEKIEKTQSNREARLKNRNQNIVVGTS